MSFVNSAKKRALLIIADGSEEMEVTITVDCLRRADIDVIIAGINGTDPVTCRSLTKIVPDCSINDVSGGFDVIIIPGGLSGVENISNCQTVKDLLINHANGNKLVAAICAGPTYLHQIGILKGRNATCYPSLSANLTECTYIDKRVVIDGNLVTSQGPSTSFEFSFAIIEILLGKDKMENVCSSILHFLPSYSLC